MRHPNVMSVIVLCFQEIKPCDVLVILFKELRSQYIVRSMVKVVVDFRYQPHSVDNSALQGRFSSAVILKRRECLLFYVSSAKHSTGAA